MFSVAIDGPAGAGKSTIAKKVAKDLSIIYVDTGAMYRAVAYFVWKKGFDCKNSEQVCSCLPEIKLEIQYSEEFGQKIILNGEDVSAEIRLPEVSNAVASVSAISEVRAFLLEQQRSLAKSQSLVMDGRDIATVVLPNADVKIFLTASPEVRAQRRFLEYQQKGIEISFETVLEDVIQRDFKDTHRDIAPLKQADDAILVDSSQLSFEETVEKIKSIISEKIK